MFPNNLEGQPGTGSYSNYKIYPVPHKMAEADYQVFSNIPAGSQLNIVAEKGIDEVTVRRAEQIIVEHGYLASKSDKPSKTGNNLFLGISGSKGIADLMAYSVDRSVFNLENVYDRHILCVAARGFFENNHSDVIKNEYKTQILVLGENTDAVFCGLASLEQIMDQGINHSVIICDWAEVKHRGVIEGYYGVPYSAEVTKDLFRFMAKYKLNTYMYGAKSDPYHSRYWSEPYPTSITPEQEKVGYLTQEMMKDITSVAKECKVDFIWAIHPGKAFADPENKDIIQQIMGKFESMYELGVRQFGVFVDDVGVPSDTKVLKLCADNLAALQNAIDQKWNRPGVSPADTVKPLQYVPQLYAYSWVDEEKAKAFFETLKPVPEKVDIYITGANVWSVPNNYDIAKVNGWLGKRTSWWWNYLCNDSDVTKLFIADAYTNFRDETHIFSTSSLEENLAGTNSIIVNPMQQGMLSRIGLFSTADYTWNTSAFNNYRSWEAAVRSVGSSALLADLSEDLFNIIPALRYYDNDKFEYLVTRYKQSVEKGKPAPGSLIAELKKVNASCARIEKNLVLSSKLSDALFYRDISPWLLKVKAMTEEAIGLLEGKNPAPLDYENDPRFRFEILGGMGEHIKMAERTAEPSAKCLLPFIYWLREQAAK
ncbi:MAG: beta-N-acetylglucosaminidase domain-containing protein [Bacteroidales bacterium]|nr:beta-N-acetylglucosaminidase domain-containing protein [Bacteroidales bacterium]